MLSCCSVGGSGKSAFIVIVRIFSLKPFSHFHRFKIFIRQKVLTNKYCKSSAILVITKLEKNVNTKLAKIIRCLKSPVTLTIPFGVLASISIDQDQPSVVLRFTMFDSFTSSSIQKLVYTLRNYPKIHFDQSVVLFRIFSET